MQCERSVRIRNLETDFRFVCVVFLLSLYLISCGAPSARDQRQETRSPETDTQPSADVNENDRNQDDSTDFSYKPSKELAPLNNPPSRSEVESSIRDGVQFLVTHQNPDGTWGTPEKTKGLNILASVPGAHHAFQSATTALCLAALAEIFPGTSRREVIRRGMKGLLDILDRLRRPTPTEIYNVWGHSFAIQALVRLLDHPVTSAADREALRKTIRQQIDMLSHYEYARGGWGYYDFRIGSDKPGGRPNSFTTATVLIALKEAKDAGFDVPAHLIRRGKQVIHRQQKPDFSYLYSSGHRYKPMGGVNRPPGSLGRSQACNAALRMWGDEKITDDVLRAWLDRLFLRNGWLDMGRKRPVPHESWFAVAGYFYYYGHFYATYAMRMLPAEDQHLYSRHFAKTVLPKQEPDGSWWDYPLYNYHKFYGTGFVLLSLHRVLHMYPDS